MITDLHLPFFEELLIREVLLVSNQRHFECCEIRLVNVRRMKKAYLGTYFHYVIILDTNQLPTCCFNVCAIYECMQT